MVVQIQHSRRDRGARRHFVSVRYVRKLRKMRENIWMAHTNSFGSLHRGSFKEQRYNGSFRERSDGSFKEHARTTCDCSFREQRRKGSFREQYTDDLQWLIQRAERQELVQRADATTLQIGGCACLVRGGHVRGRSVREI